MEQKEILTTLVDRYFNGTLQKYKETTMQAMKLSRKMGIFKKNDFSAHVEAFVQYAEEASAMLKELEGLEISEEPTARDLHKALRASLQSFRDLCQRNAEHYDLMDRKQYRKNGITLDDFKLSMAGVNSMTGSAVEDLDILERANRLFHGEEVEIADEDIREDYWEQEAEAQEEETQEDAKAYSLEEEDE